MPPVSFPKALFAHVVGAVGADHHQRLEQWMRCFNGAATKYLDNYLRWHVFVEATKDLAGRAARIRLLRDACAGCGARTRR